MILLAFSISVRLQTGLILGFFVVVSASLRVLPKTIIIGILLALMTGYLIDLGFSHMNPNREYKRINSRVPVYTGLIASDETGVWCGSWTPEAAKKAGAEVDLALIDILQKYLQEGKWQRIMQCKFVKVISFDTLSAPWFWESLTISTQHTSQQTENIIQNLIKIERYVIQLEKLFILTGLMILIYQKKYKQSAIIAIFILGYLIALLIFEIQPRYMLLLYTVVPYYIIECMYREKNKGIN